MNFVQIFAFILALCGFGMTFWGLQNMHKIETNIPRVLFVLGVVFITIGTLLFFVESLYQGVIISSVVPNKTVVRQKTSPQVTNVSSNSAQPAMSILSQQPQTFIQQFMPTCTTMLGQKAATACPCILNILEKNYTNQQLQNIKSPSDIPGSLTASIAACVQK